MESLIEDGAAGGCARVDWGRHVIGHWRRARGKEERNRNDTAEEASSAGGLVALATAALGGTAPIALGDDDPHPAHPTCTWSVDKTASLHSNPGVPITTLTLSLDQTVTVVYKIVVTRDCEAGFDPGAHGAGARHRRQPCRDARDSPVPRQPEPARFGDVHVQP